MKFRKKPIIIEAIQLTWQNWNEICNFVPIPWFIGGCFIDKDGNILDEHTMNLGEGHLGLRIKTLESNEFLAQQDDWIIKGIDGEFYACKPLIFEKTYEKVEE